MAEAVWHARGRSAFGALLVDQPAMTAVLADLALEAEAAMLTGMRLAQAFEAEASDRDIAFRRLATPVSKYWVCKRGPHHAYEALECLGGNGYTESFPLALRYREQPVMAVWEGSGNVVALDVLRAMTREPDSVEAFADELAETRGASPLLDAHVEQALAADALAGGRRARRSAGPGAPTLGGARDRPAGVVDDRATRRRLPPMPSSRRASARTRGAVRRAAARYGCRGDRGTALTAAAAGAPGDYGCLLGWQSSTRSTIPPKGTRPMKRKAQCSPASLSRRTVTASVGM